jgi:hypothetical protein
MRISSLQFNSFGCGLGARGAKPEPVQFEGKVAVEPSVLAKGNSWR